MKRWILILGLILLTSGCTSKSQNAVDFLQGDLAFVPQESSVLVVNIAAPTQPELVATLNLPGRVLKVVADGRFAYIIYEQYLETIRTGLQIVDMADPAQPQLQATYNTQHYLTNAIVQDDLLVLAHWEGITLLDVANKNEPKVFSELLHNARNYGLHLDGNQLLTTWGGCDFRSGFCTGGLLVYDVSNPQQPEEISYLEQHELPGYDVAASDGYAFVNGKGVWVVELTGEPALQINGRTQTAVGDLYNGQIAVQDSIAYASQTDGLHLLDISQPTAPTNLGRYVPTGYLFDLTVRDQYAYLVSENGLEIVDVTDPTNPQLLGIFATGSPVPIAPQPTATP